MRILILLTLGIVSVAGLVFGVRLVWQALHPASAPEIPLPAWLDERARRWLLVVAVVVCVIAALVDILSTQNDPAEHQPPPTVPSSTVPIRPVR
ncbi:MAG: hypothetical protein HQL91_12345 [Magnetococcales bacterium]|nr:hypothetical protein [Magnetococcales bacterium]